MLEMFAYPFMQKAFVASVLIGVTCSFLGTFVILRGMTFMGSGVSHAAFTGAALGVLLDVPVPQVLAFAFSALMALLIGHIVARGAVKHDVAIGILFTTNVALGFVFVALMTEISTDVLSLLWGDVLAASWTDVALIALAGLLSVGVVLGLFKEYRAYIFSESLAQACGIPVRRLTYGLLFLVAFLVVTALDTVGALMISAFMIIPAATALQLTYRLEHMVVFSVLFGLSASVLGLFAAFYLNLPSGAAIVVIAAVQFALVFPIAPKRRG
jgi:ABC-type Mn2+/Zn2+ transport system permease subunit